MAREEEALGTLLVCLIVIPLAWLLFLGWHPYLLIMGNDGPMYFLPNLLELMQNGNDWENLIYRTDIFGGEKVTGSMGGLPFACFLGLLGLSPITRLNLYVFFVQTAVAFLGICSLSSLLALWGKKKRLSLPLKVGLVLLFAFAPVLGWRIGYGHLNLLFGLLFFVVLCSMIIVLRSGEGGIVFLLVAFLCLVSAFSSYGYQMILYGIVFGCPVILVLLFSPLVREDKLHKTVLTVVLLLLGSFLVVLPLFFERLDNLISGDSARLIAGESVIYSYTTATLRDWISSFPWAQDFIANNRAAYLHHETNYPLGPLLLLLLLLPRRRMRFLATALGLTLLGVIFFSMNVGPISDLVSSVITPLEAYRVPARAMIPVAVFLPVLALSCFVFRFDGLGDSRSRTISLISWVLVTVVVCSIPAFFREILLWLVLSIVVLVGFGLLKRMRDLLEPAHFVLFLGIASLLFFKERLLPFVHADVLERASSIGENLKKEDPELRAPLSRVHLGNFQIPPLDVSTAVLAGMSSVDGYGFPPRRFLRLITALSGSPHDQIIHHVLIDERNPAFGVIRQLYNVCCAVESDGTRTYVRDLGKRAGPAWFSGRIESLRSFEELADRMKRYGDSLHWKVRATAWILEEDPAIIEAVLPREIDGACRESAVVGVSELDMGGIAAVEVKNASDCPLTLAVNYSANLRAYADSEEHGEREIRLLPVYGSLTGMIVPEGSDRVFIRAEPSSPGWLHAVSYLGYVMLLIAVFWHFKETARH